MKKPCYWALLLGSLWLPAAAAEELSSEDCEPAVDMIESNDAVNRISDCDYSKDGLGGWLANLAGNDSAEASKSAPASETVVDSKQVEATDPATNVERAGSVAAVEIASGPLSDGLALLQARFELLKRSAAACAPQRAQVHSEQVQKLEKGQIQLLLSYGCTSH